MAGRDGEHEPREPGAGLYILGTPVAALASVAVCTLWVGITPMWLAALLGAVAGLAGLVLAENIGEAIVLSLITAVILVFLLWYVPGLDLVKMCVAPLGVGLATGKLIGGMRKEIHA